MSSSDLKPACEARSAAVVASANKEFRERILKRLGSRSWTVEEALGGAEALSLVEEGAFKALLLDRWLPDLDVSELVDIIKARHPQVQVLVVGSEVEERRLVERLSPQKDLPLDFPDAQESRECETGAEGLRERPGGTAGIVTEVKGEEPLPGMMGSSRAMQRAYRLARLVIPRDTTVLIMGETGTGKELMARAIHNLGSRARQPFVIVNSAAIPETLLESELFGYSRGGFHGSIPVAVGKDPFCAWWHAFPGRSGRTASGHAGQVTALPARGGSPTVGKPGRIPGGCAGDRSHERRSGACHGRRALQRRALLSAMRFSDRTCAAPREERRHTPLGSSLSGLVLSRGCGSVQVNSLRGGQDFGGLLVAWERS